MLRKRLSSLSTRFYAIVALSFVLTAILSQILLSLAVDSAYEMRDLHLADVSESAVSVLEDLQAQVESGTLTLEEAKAEGHRVLSAMRYGESGYFYAYDGDHVARVLPTKPEWIGQDKSDLKDVNGVRLVEELVRIAKTEGKGSLTYHFTKPGSDIPEAKIGYAVWFAPWEWMVGTGSYVEDIEEDLALLQRTSLIAMGASLVALLAVSAILIRSIINPLKSLVERMKTMREDDLEAEVPFTGSRSELGSMARSINVFREQLVERKALEAEQAEKDAEIAHQKEEALQQQLEMEQREAKQAERRREEEEKQRVEREEQRATVEAEREARRAEQAKVVAALSQSLGAMSQGDLSARIVEAFPEDYEELRRNFNEAIERISSLVRAIVEGSRTINGESDTLNNAATEMSRRTESQAASLEETAAAITQLSASVDNSSKGAHEASSTVGKAQEKTEAGRMVVEKTIVSMTEIAESSGKISKITNVIDEIAFQTNLLALNAGVEAARAGEAGRGFSVVASEVRALAQRSSEAAKEIAQLISTSGDQVESGVALVKDSGEALQEIETLVVSLNGLVEAVADSSVQQSTALSEISVAVNRLDQVTQQNAAMFEETTAAVGSLKAQASELDRNSSSFRLDEERIVAMPSRSREPETTSKRNRTSVDVAVNATPFAAAVNEQEEDEGWADF
ncbi:methyl-accepting chemotaxis protein [Tropicimonas sp. TH_r6]|uniref:methyl-accepting chemotaxis protein n=1 Tax=Tropicimonas sp. TH_r6 TaxID=3082085 RepID=UPI0029550548|nr:methyl-accepting chemotaxis protein [Tropicimonas sp. TH_r6]MDV7145759.1 methyl-accepting chemotaxis protein [Tropicimonas sp. TH_r6]